MSTDSSATPRVLVSFYKQLGDLVLLQPAIAELVRQHGSPVAIHAKPGLSTIIELIPDAVAVAEPRGRFDHIWLFEASFRPLRQVLRCRAPQRHLAARSAADLKWYHGLWFNDFRIDEHWRTTYNAVFYSQAVGNPTDAPQPRLLMPPTQWLDADLPADDYIVLNPTGFVPSKGWLADHWAAVLDGLAGHFPGYVLLTGIDSGWQAEHIQAIADATGNPRVINLMGRTSLKSFIGLLSRARLVMGVEGAAIHMAQAFGVPAVSLFCRDNRSTAEHWSAASATLRTLVENGMGQPQHALCVDAISPAQVLAASEELLGGL